jgi:hypothetical protein
MQEIGGDPTGGPDSDEDQTAQAVQGDEARRPTNSGDSVRLSADTSNAEGSDLAEARDAVTDFQRELYKVRDGRITAADNASSVLAVAAGTVATVAAGVLREATNSTPVVVILSLAALSIVVTTFGRREQPIFAGKVKCEGRKAEDAVRAVHDKAKDASISRSDMLELCFDAWYWCHESANARESQKRVIYSVALVFFLVEVLALVLVVAGIGPPGWLPPGLRDLWGTLLTAEP